MAPKVLLRFELPEERDELYYAQNGAQFAIVVEKLKHHLRSKLKYEPNISDAQRETYDDVQSTLYDLLSEYEISR